MLDKLFRSILVFGTVGIAGFFAGSSNVTSQNVVAQSQTNKSTSNRILQINFTYNGSTSDFKQQMKNVAPRVARASGLRWKIWSIDESKKEASGFYLFENETAMNNYLEKVFFVGMGNNPMISNISVKKLSILEDPTTITRGPVFNN